MLVVDEENLFHLVGVDLELLEGFAVGRVSEDLRESGHHSRGMPDDLELQTLVYFWESHDVLQENHLHVGVGVVDVEATVAFFDVSYTSTGDFFGLLGDLEFDLDEIAEGIQKNGGSAEENDKAFASMPQEDGLDLLQKGLPDRNDLDDFGAPLLQILNQERVLENQVGEIELFVDGERQVGVEGVLFPPSEQTGVDELVSGKTLVAEDLVTGLDTHWISLNLTNFHYTSRRRGRS